MKSIRQGTLKVTIIYLAFFGLLIGTFMTLLANDISPDRKILGKWKEVSWEYEKIDTEDSTQSSFPFNITERMKQEIGKDLIIHQAEIWDFSREQGLLLAGKEKEKLTLDWKLKGRGHVLQLKSKDKEPEFYQVQDLADDRMVLHFNFDLQVRGIVKMTFEKIRE